jgi:hypothetical protein
MPEHLGKSRQRPVDQIAARVVLFEIVGMPARVDHRRLGPLAAVDYVVSNTTSNRFGAVNGTNTLTFDVWYDLPSLRREALITVQLTFQDTDGLTFSKSIEVRVAP